MMDLFAKVAVSLTQRALNVGRALYRDAKNLVVSTANLFKSPGYKRLAKTVGHAGEVIKWTTPQSAGVEAAKAFLSPAKP